MATRWIVAICGPHADRFSSEPAALQKPDLLRLAGSVCGWRAEFLFLYRAGVFELVVPARMADSMTVSATPRCLRSNTRRVRAGLMDSYSLLTHSPGSE